MNTNWEDRIREHFDGNDTVFELFKRNVVSALLHIIFCVTFFALGVWEMGVYNIICPIYFLMIIRALWTGRIKDTWRVDNLDSVEFVIHSILAVCFTGFSLGFQYILFTLAIPMVVLADDRNNQRYNFLRAAVAVGIFIVLQLCLQYKIIVPKYQFSDTLSIIFSSLMIMMVFLLLNSQIISSFRNFEGHMKEYRQKELDAARKANEINMHVISNIAGIIEQRDESTGKHTERTTNYVEAICRELVREG